MPYTVGEVNAPITADPSNFNHAIGEVQKTGQQAAVGIAQNFDKTGRELQKFGGSLTKRVTLPIAGVGVAASVMGMRFEESMSGVQALTGATAQDMGRLEKQARDLGSTTRFSASEAGEAMQFLGMAGFNTNQILGAMPGLLDLAAAGSLDLASAADITSNIMSGFSMEAEEASRVADVLAKTASSANTDVFQMGEAMKFVAPVASGLGISVEETAAAIGILGDAGIQASMAGTTLRSGLLRLASPTENVQKAMNDLGVEFFNSEGQMKSLTEIIEQLEGAFDGLTEQQRTQALEMLFGKNAVSGWMAILDAGSHKLGGFTHELENANGAAGEMAKIMEDNTAGSLRELRSAAEGLGIEFFQTFQPAIAQGIELLTDITRAVSNMDDRTKHMITSIGIAAGAFGPLVMAGGTLLTTLGPIVGTLSSVTGGLGAVGGAAGIAGAGMTGLLGPVGLATLAIAGTGAAAVGLAHHLSQDALPAVDIFGEGISETTQEAVESFRHLKDDATIQLNEMLWNGIEVTEEMAQSMGQNFSKMHEEFNETVENSLQRNLELWEEYYQDNEDMTEEEFEKGKQNIIDHHEDLEEQFQSHMDRLLEIKETALAEERALTESEANEINRIYDNMFDMQLLAATETMDEYLQIKELMSGQAAEIDAEMAAKITKTAWKTYEETVEAAKAEREDRLREAEALRIAYGEEGEEMANKAIAEAEREHEETLKMARNHRENLIGNAKLSALEYINEIDWMSGESQSKWRQLVNRITGEQDNALVELISWMDAQGKELDKGQLEMLGISEQNYRKMQIIIAEALDMIERDNEKTADDLVEVYSALEFHMRTAGQNSMRGVREGMNSQQDELRATARRIAESINREFNQALQIRSPSRVMYRSGEETMEGLRLGIEAEGKGIISTVRKIADGIAGAANVSRLFGPSTAMMPHMPQFVGHHQPEMASTTSAFFNFDGAFRGATIQANTDQDVDELSEKLFRKLYEKFVSRTRAQGGAQ